MFNNDQSIWAISRCVLNLHSYQVISLSQAAQEFISCGAMSLVGYCLLYAEIGISMQRQWTDLECN